MSSPCLQVIKLTDNRPFRPATSGGGGAEGQRRGHGNGNWRHRRGVRIGRIFSTLGSGLVLRLYERMFSGTAARGDHPSEDRACLDVGDLNHALVRCVVDVRHNTPYEGLCRCTPLEQWEADHRADNHPLIPLPAA